MTPFGGFYSLTHARSRAVIFAITWLVSTLFLAWLMLQRSSGFNSSVTLYALAALLLCTFGLVLWLPSPIREESVRLHHAEQRTHPFRLLLLILAACAVLFPLRTLVGPPLLFGLPVVAVIVLAVLRQPISRRSVAYAGTLALVAGIAGLGAGWITSFSPLLWGGLQVLLTLTGLLAGWAILHHSGLSEYGVARSQFLQAGIKPAIKAAGMGIIIGIPWSLGMIVMGSAERETWVQAWWQPLTAAQPGIAEEAWGRVLLVPLLFLLFRLAARPRAAFTVALVVAAYWFAYLHTPGGIGALPSTLITGTIFALPVSFICLYKDIETAVGFHFWLDFFKFFWALLFL